MHRDNAGIGAAGQVHDVALRHRERERERERERDGTDLFIWCVAGFKCDDIYPFTFDNCTRCQCKPLTNKKHNIIQI